MGPRLRMTMASGPSKAAFNNLKVRQCHGPWHRGFVPLITQAQVYVKTALALELKGRQLRELCAANGTGGAQYNKILAELKNVTVYTR